MFPTQFKIKKDGDLIYAEIETQGWRPYMEDYILNKRIKNHKGEWDQIFGIFDGHGGPLVSLFCKIVLPLVMQKNL